MASITNLGSVSGLPLEETLKKLQDAEDKKLSIYDTRTASYKTRIDAYSKLQSALEAVQKAAGSWVRPKPWRRSRAASPAEPR